MNKLFYYKFWISTSGQSSSLFVKCYNKKPDKETLESDLKDWSQGLSFYGVAESWNEGYDEIKIVPKNRKDCLRQWNDVCKQRDKINKRYNLLRNLLNCPPFNGQKP